MFELVGLERICIKIKLNNSAVNQLVELLLLIKLAKYKSVTTSTNYFSIIAYGYGGRQGHQLKE
ncbi:hypothetical protein P1X16_28590 [Hymenobacter sp. YC55]|nr:hypothetical protein [Hymenobacter sp. YC55]